MLRREHGDALKAQAGLLGKGVPQAIDARVKQADDVPGVGGLHHGALIRHELLGRLELDLLVLPGMPGVHVAPEHARDHAHKGQAVAVGRVHVGLDLENKAAEVRAVRPDLPLVAHARRGRQGIGQKAVQKGLHPEVGDG